MTDLGIVGRNEYEERMEEAEVVRPLGFSRCRMSLAIPKAIDYPGLSWFEGKKIATSYPNILRRFLQDHHIVADIHVITGSVEISPGIGLCRIFFIDKSKEIDIVTYIRLIWRRSSVLLFMNLWCLLEEKKEK